MNVNILREAIVKSGYDLWSETIRDIQYGQPNDAERIEEICKAVGWGDWFLNPRGKEGYDEAPGERWCGLGVAYILSEILPKKTGYKIHPDIASQILPSTHKLYDRSNWEELGFERPSATLDDIKKGMIATVGSGPAGSHILIVADVHPDQDGTYETIECNGRDGILGDGKWGEGVIRRFDCKGVEDYNGDPHDVRARKISRIKQLYPLEPKHFVEV